MEKSMRNWREKNDRAESTAGEIICPASTPLSAGRQRERAWELAAFEKRIKPNPHTAEEMEEYLTKVCHAKKQPEDLKRFQKMRDTMKLELMNAFAPCLLPRPVRYPADRNDAEKLRKYFDDMTRREEWAGRIRKEEFPTDFVFYEIGIRVRKTPSGAERLLSALKGRWKKTAGETEGRQTAAVVRVAIEKNRGMIRGEAMGEKPALDKAGKILWEIYSFYGVTEKNIREKDSRFKTLFRLSYLYGCGRVDRGGQGGR